MNICQQQPHIIRNIATRLKLKDINKEINILLYYYLSLILIIRNTISIIRLKESNILGILLLGNTIYIYNI